MIDGATNTCKDAKQSGVHKMTMYCPQNYSKEYGSFKDRQCLGLPLKISTGNA